MCGWPVAAIANVIMFNLEGKTHSSEHYLGIGLKVHLVAVGDCVCNWVRLKVPAASEKSKTKDTHRYWSMWLGKKAKNGIMISST